MGEHILIVGAGSAGKRHGRNLVELGCTISAFDPRGDRLGEAEKDTGGLQGRFRDLDDALGAGAYDGAVVASPPRFHVEQARRLLEAGIPLLLEKPVAPTLNDARSLRDAADDPIRLLLGYTYRWWEPLMALRDRLPELGTLRHARFVMSAHLADWHPWESYEDFFMSSERLGGGALLDESHFIDLMIWLFGMPDVVSGRVERLSSLNITSDDNVDALCSYGDGMRVSIHLDLYGRPHEKSVSVTGEQGTAQCLFDPNAVRVGHEPAGWQETPFECDRNSMFMAEAEDFLAMIRDEKAPPCTLEDGLRTLTIVEAIRESTRTGCGVEVSE